MWVYANISIKHKKVSNIHYQTCKANSVCTYLNLAALLDVFLLDHIHNIIVPSTFESSVKTDCSQLRNCVSFHLLISGKGFNLNFWDKQLPLFDDVLRLVSSFWLLS